MNGKQNTLLHSRWFETTIVVVIILAGVLAGLETSPPLVARFGTLLDALDLVVLVIFIVGIALKTQPPPVSMGSSGRLAHSAQPPSYQLTRR
jgi:hypothetical protein